MGPFTGAMLFVTVCVLIVIFPLCKALLGGIASVREKSDPTDEASAFSSFFSSVRRLLGWWPIVWLLFLFGPIWVLIVSLRLDNDTPESPPLIYYILFGSSLQAAVLAICLIVVVNGLLLAPGFRRTWSLVLATYTSTLGLVIVLTFILKGIGFFIPRERSVIAFHFPENQYGEVYDHVEMFPVIYLALSLLILVCVCKWIRRHEREWFGLEG